MLPLNAYVIKSRGHFLNWGVDFRGGSEILIEFSRPVEAGDVRKTLAENGFHDADVVKYEDPTGKKKWNYLVRVGAVSVVSEAQAKQIRESLAKVGEATHAPLRVVRGRRQDLPALRPAGRAVGAAELAEGDRRQRHAGAAVRPRSRTTPTR